MQWEFTVCTVSKERPNILTITMGSKATIIHSMGDAKYYVIAAVMCFGKTHRVNSISMKSIQKRLRKRGEKIKNAEFKHKNVEKVGYRGYGDDYKDLNSEMLIEEISLLLLDVVINPVDDSSFLCRLLHIQDIDTTYKALELLPYKQYFTSFGVWSTGCIFAELVQQCPLFPCYAELHELAEIFSIWGTPTEETCLAVASACPAVNTFSIVNPKDLAAIAPLVYPSYVLLLSIQLLPAVLCLSKDMGPEGYNVDAAHIAIVQADWGVLSDCSGAELKLGVLDSFAQASSIIRQYGSVYLRHGNLSMALDTINECLSEAICVFSRGRLDGESRTAGLIHSGSKILETFKYYPDFQACVPDLLNAALHCLENVKDSDGSVRALRTKIMNFLANNLNINWSRDPYERVLLEACEEDCCNLMCCNSD